MQRKTRTHVPNFADPAKKGEPRSFVFWRGKHGVRRPSAFKDGLLVYTEAEPDLSWMLASTVV